MTAVLVFLGGGLGSLCRFLVGAAGARWLGERFPIGTLVVNLLGCLLIGLAMGLVEARAIDPRARVALVAGFLGGFTTYSAFAYEALALLERRGAAWAALYAGLTVAGGFVACALGLLVARRLT